MTKPKKRVQAKKPKKRAPAKKPKKRARVSKFEKQVIAAVKEMVAVHRGEMLPSRVTLGYKGYIGVAVPDYERGDMHGTVVNTRDVITFVGKPDDLPKELKASVEFYLEMCAKYGLKPNKPWK